MEGGAPCELGVGWPRSRGPPDAAPPSAALADASGPESPRRAPSSRGAPRLREKPKNRKTEIFCHIELVPDPYTDLNPASHRYWSHSSSNWAKRGVGATRFPPAW